jgi:hypothetical protein
MKNCRNDENLNSFSQLSRSRDRDHPEGEHPFRVRGVRTARGCPSGMARFDPLRTVALAAKTERTGRMQNGGCSLKMDQG